MVAVATAQAPISRGSDSPGPRAVQAAPAPSFSEQLSGGTVREIRIEGTERIEPETVRSYLAIQPGDPFDSDRVDRSLKALYATSLFADVSIKRDGDALIVSVVENPIINRISYEGNKKLKDDALGKELKLQPRTVFTRTKVQADVKRILELYRRNGRFSATVDPKVIQLPQNRVDLVFEIHEGSNTGIKAIEFVGNREFDAAALKGILSTKESRWYRFLSNSDTYDPDHLTYDRELLRKFYLSQGFADFRVVSAIAELAPRRDGFFITFTIEEGNRYKFGKIDVASELKDIKPDDLIPYVTMSEGDQYNADEVEKTINQLTDALGNRGFAFVDIEPHVNRDPDARTVSITFDIKEGPRVYIERINIAGNVRTLDKVIRREFRLVEGDAFNSSKLHRSQQRIQNLGYFKKVDVTNTQGSAPDKTIVNVNVEEQSTGEFSVGVGFSSTDGPLADISVRERNLLGRGQDMRVGFTIAQRVQQIDLSFTEPYFLDRNLAAGVDLFETVQNNQVASEFDQQSLGASLRLGYQITEPLRQTLNYTIRKDEVYNVQPFASAFIKEEAGRRNTSSIGQVLLYDKRDNRETPSSGYFLQLANNLAGLPIGGNVRYIRSVLNGGYYLPLAPKWVVGITGEAGYISGINDTVRIEDRFFVGGDNLRGFKIAGIGPRDIRTNDALGGDAYFVGSVQLNLPTGLPEEFGITARAFTDFGTLWDTNDHGPTVVDNAALRLSAGVGVSWKSPMGPIRFDLGIPFIRQTYDKSQYFRVNFGTQF